jgi:hypothetical protein
MNAFAASAARERVRKPGLILSGTVVGLAENGWKTICLVFLVNIKSENPVLDPFLKPWKKDPPVF